jgi:hypothetical protein
MGKGSKPVMLSQLTGRGQIGYTVRRNWRVALAGDQSETETQSTAKERQQASD